MSLGERLHDFDRLQQRRRWLSFIFGVLKKYGDDQAGLLAALVAYFGFFSLFPLLLVFVTVLGFVLQGDVSLQHSIRDSVLSQFPIIGNQLRNNVSSLKGSTAALVIGLVFSLMGGLGVTNAAQTAFNRVWHVPFRSRPNWYKTRLRGLMLLGVFGVLSIISTVVAGFVTAQSRGALLLVVGIVVAFLANLALFFAVFRLMSPDDVETHQLWTGVLVAAVFWQLLQHLGGYYVNHTLKHAHEVYGLFATVIGLLTFLHLGAQVVLLAVEVDVVRVRRLWPRSLFGDELTPADRAALKASAEVEERVNDENVEVSFGAGADGSTRART